MRYRFLLFFTFVSYFLFISSSGKAIGQTSSEQKTSVTHFQLFQKNTCKTDADCVLVNKDCCGCGSGGESIAIPISQKESYKRKRKLKCDWIEKITGPINCFEAMRCQLFQAQCIDSKCLTKKCNNPCPIYTTPKPETNESDRVENSQN